MRTRERTRVRTRAPMPAPLAQERTGWIERHALLAMARVRRQSQPVIILECAVVIALLALLYLSQVAAVTAAHQTLLQEQTRQSDLRRQDADLRAQLGTLQNPTYIEQRAHGLGMVPASPTSVVWITIHNSGK